MPSRMLSVLLTVSGYVDDVRVKNNRFVHKGDVLFVVDRGAPYRIALADAEAALEARRAQQLMLRARSEQHTAQVRVTNAARRLIVRKTSRHANTNYQQACHTR